MSGNFWLEKALNDEMQECAELDKQSWFGHSNRDLYPGSVPNIKNVFSRPTLKERDKAKQRITLDFLPVKNKIIIKEIKMPIQPVYSDKIKRLNWQDEGELEVIAKGHFIHFKDFYTNKKMPHGYIWKEKQVTNKDWIPQEIYVLDNLQIKSVTAKHIKDSEEFEFESTIVIKYESLKAMEWK